jgi:hypothetical protein
MNNKILVEAFEQAGRELQFSLRIAGIRPKEQKS